MTEKFELTLEELFRRAKAQNSIKMAHNARSAMRGVFGNDGVMIEAIASSESRDIADTLNITVMAAGLIKRAAEAMLRKSTDAGRLKDTFEEQMVEEAPWSAIIRWNPQIIIDKLSISDSGATEYKCAYAWIQTGESTTNGCLLLGTEPIGGEFAQKATVAYLNEVFSGAISVLHHSDTYRYAGTIFYAHYLSDYEIIEEIPKISPVTLKDLQGPKWYDADLDMEWKNVDLRVMHMVFLAHRISGLLPDDYFSLGNILRQITPATRVKDLEQRMNRAYAALCQQEADHISYIEEIKRASAPKTRKSSRQRSVVCERVYKSPNIATRERIADFLMSLPNVHDQSARRAFTSGLDPQLKDQINYNGPSAQFFNSFVSTLEDYGKLADGTHAVHAVLETAKTYVGSDKRREASDLIAATTIA